MPRPSSEITAQQALQAKMLLISMQQAGNPGGGLAYIAPAPAPQQPTGGGYHAAGNLLQQLASNLGGNREGIRTPAHAARPAYATPSRTHVQSGATPPPLSPPRDIHQRRRQIS